MRPQALNKLYTPLLSRGNSLKRLVFSALFIIGILVTQQCDSKQKEFTNRGYKVQLGDVAPEFSMRLTSGETISLGASRGKVVVLQFTASWCSVCRKEMPHLEKEVWLPNKDKDFILIGIDYDEPLEKVIAFIKQMNITYPMALDPNADIFGLFAHKKSGVTRNVVIDKDGKIVFLTRLYDVEEFDAMKEKIEELLVQED